MGKWRVKLGWWLMVYIAGFLTAVYLLAPAPELSAQQQTAQTQVEHHRAPLLTSANKEQMAASISAGLHKCVHLGKKAVSHVAASVKENWNQRSTQSSEGS
ncbi:hypothetical protein ACFL6U_21320 [Planctomycetota bacterium]